MRAYGPENRRGQVGSELGPIAAAGSLIAAFANPLYL